MNYHWLQEWICYKRTSYLEAGQVVEGLDGNLLVVLRLHLCLDPGMLQSIDS